MGVAAFNLILTGLFIMMQPSIEVPRHNKWITIETRILIIPSFQSKIISAETLEKGVAGVVMGGNVTASFPEELVVFEASSDRNYDELINLIKDRISSYPCSCGDFIEITPHAKYNVTLDSSTMRQFIYEVHDWINGQGEYWLNFSIYTNEHEIFLNFLCEAIYYDSLILDKRGRIFRKELFNRTIEMNLSQTILIGFAPPKAQNGYRGSAYWFIISKPGDTVLSFILSVDTFFQKLA